MTVLSDPGAALALRVRKCQANLYSWLALKEMKASDSVIKVELNYSSSKNLLCLPKLLIKVFFSLLSLRIIICRRKFAANQRNKKRQQPRITCFFRERKASIF